MNWRAKSAGESCSSFIPAEDTTAFGRGGMRHRMSGMSPHVALAKGPRALPVGLHWLIFLMVVNIGVFSVQNSNAPSVVIKILLWRFETSLVYTFLGSVGVGILITLFFWIPRAIKTSIRSKELKQEIKNLETVLGKPGPLGQEGNKAKGS
jgi:uncharacterized integral membrane protein